MSKETKLKTGEEIDVSLPKMGESISEATIITWQVQEGDQVEKDQVILEVATDKVDSEVPAPASGIIKDFLVHTGDVVKIGDPIAKLEVQEVTKNSEKTTGTSSPKKSQKEKPPKSKQLKKQPQKQQAGQQHSTNGESRELKVPRNNNLNISPLIKTIAKDYDIPFSELMRISASGKEGRLRKTDLFNYIAQGRPSAGVVEAPVSKAESGFKLPDLKFDKGKGKIVEMDRMRQMIADHMVFSKHTSPHVTAYVEADLTNMVNWRNTHKKEFQEKHSEKLTFTPLFIQAVTKALKDFPNMNSSLDGKNIIVKDELNVGMATALPSGNLIVPVVKNAGKKDLPELAAGVNDLAQKARDNKLKHDETSGGTFTISNVGTFGSFMGTPIINQPEVGILATGIIKKRAEVMEYEDGDKIEIRNMMYLSLSFDHRVVDGFLGGSFLRHVADYMEDYKAEK